MPYNESFGVFSSSSSVQSLSKDALKLLHYKTTTSSEHDGKRLPPDAQGENFYDFYKVGQKDTKYMGIRLRTVPNFHRNSCEYSKNYVRKEGNYATDRQLAKSFKGPQHKSKSVGSLDGTTVKSKEFLWVSEEARSGARQQNQKPSVGMTNTTGGTGVFIEREPQSHSLHRVPNVEVLSKLSRGPRIPQDNLGVPFHCLKDNFRTAYQRHYLESLPTAPGVRSSSANKK